MTVHSSQTPFLWGVATSSYQIEGAVGEDGRGPSVWDTFCRRPGAVRDGVTGDVACDHYHRWREDIDLMASLGIRSYRFSIAWPRVLPEGRGRVNTAGLDFYSRLVDGLLERDIVPMATLFHWDMPQALEDRGGWRVRGAAEALGEYTAVVARHLGDRVKLWATINEMWCVVYHGHRDGCHAPGRRDDEKTLRQVSHHMLLGHGLSVQALRAAATGVQVGIVHNPAVTEPFSESTEDIAAARADFHRLNAWMMDPLFRGSYPAAEWDALGDATPEVHEGDLAAISAPTDFLGLNVYFGAGHIQAGGTLQPYGSHHPRTDRGWTINPDCLRWAARFSQDLYDPPVIHITESGCSYPDQVDERGEVIDWARIEYLRTHLAGVARAITEGVRIGGYHVWSLMDNFEWGLGYQSRFGLVHVNFETQRRTPKASAAWYARLIASQPHGPRVSP